MDCSFSMFLHFLVRAKWDLNVDGNCAGLASVRGTEGPFSRQNLIRSEEKLRFVSIGLVRWSTQKVLESS